MPTRAFINIESLRRTSAKGTIGSAAFHVSGQQGNTNKSTQSFTTLTIHRWERDEVIFSARYNEGLTSDVRDTNNGQAHLRYTLMDREPWAVENFIQGEYDQFKSLLSRALVGIGLRHRLIQNEELSLFAGLGAFSESERYSGDINKDGSRANTYLAYAQRITENASASATLYYQPLFHDSSDERIRLQADIDLDISERLSFNLQYQLSRESWVLPGVKTTDTMYLTGFKMKY